MLNNWVKEFDGSITVCDDKGIIIDMNDAAVRNFGKDLIGRSLFDCHPESAGRKLRDLMDTRKTNVYSIEKNGIKKLICQSPWYTAGKYMGFIEIVIGIPENMPHFIRDAQKK